jgi:hypothetical protein
VVTGTTGVEVGVGVFVGVGVGVGELRTPAAYKIELPTILVNVEPVVVILAKNELILTRVEFPTCLVAKRRTESEVYDAKRVAPDTKVGDVFVACPPPNDVPIPSVITDGVETVKLPDGLLD